VASSDHTWSAESLDKAGFSFAVAAFLIHWLLVRVQDGPPNDPADLAFAGFLLVSPIERYERDCDTARLVVGSRFSVSGRVSVSVSLAVLFVFTMFL
jgi:hypothetical protein